MAYPSPELRSLSCAVPMGFVRAVVYVYAGGRRLCPASLVSGCIGDTRARVWSVWSLVWSGATGVGSVLVLLCLCSQGVHLVRCAFSNNYGLFYCRLPLPRRMNGLDSEKRSPTPSPTWTSCPRRVQ